jgi:tRNA(Ile)-lysidine synthase
VLHVDHGLRADSARDAGFVRMLGARLGVPVEVRRVEVGPGSVEAAARAARYAALEAEADRVGATRIATGHTADDQAETVLMRVLAGAGVRGLAAIPPVRGRVIRPLLDVRRPALRELLVAAGLPWLEDPTNQDRRFARNRIRHDVLPVLAGAVDTDVVPLLVRTARLAREAVDALEQTARARRWPPCLRPWRPRCCGEPPSGWEAGPCSGRGRIAVCAGCSPRRHRGGRSGSAR